MIENKLFVAFVGLVVGFCLWWLLESYLETPDRTPNPRVHQSNVTTASVVEYPEDGEWNDGVKTIEINPSGKASFAPHEIEVPHGGCGIEATKIIKSCLASHRWETKNNSDLSWEDIEAVVDEYVRRRSTNYCDCGERMFETNDGDYICPWCSRGISPEAVA